MPFFILFLNAKLFLGTIHVVMTVSVKIVKCPREYRPAILSDALSAWRILETPSHYETQTGKHFIV